MMMKLFQRIVMTGIYLFPLHTLRHNIPSLYHSTAIVAVNPYRPFPSIQSSHYRKLYLNPEQLPMNLPNEIHIIDITPSTIDDSKTPLLPIDTTLYTMWSTWRNNLHYGKQDVSTDEYKILEKIVATQLHNIILTDRIMKQKTIVYVPFFWVMPQSAWKYLTPSDKDSIIVLSPMIDESRRIPIGDYTFMEEKEMMKNKI